MHGSPLVATDELHSVGELTRVCCRYLKLRLLAAQLLEHLRMLVPLPCVSREKLLELELNLPKLLQGHRRTTMWTELAGELCKMVRPLRRLLLQLLPRSRVLLEVAVRRHELRV